ncbi:hypothetical protein QUF64_14965 [Anaerolineales bacterium HSG6]|nr:hypothetical protein [Anaerolineales bacterium HSG6]MDM8530147.1 hypothetical protein [Anaerolineales bacterium HSG25]
MSIDSPKELLKAWKTESLTEERAIGQLLQHLVRLEEALQANQQRRTAMQNGIDSNNVSWANLKLAVDEINRQMTHVNRRLDRLEKHASLPPLPPTKRRGRPPKK